MKFLLAVVLLIPSVTLAGPITGNMLSFDGLQTGEQVLNYYNGGLGGSGSGPGPNFGVSFTTGLAADSTFIAFGHSALITAPSVTMNLANSWTGAFSFYLMGTGTLSLFAGQNASGGLVASYSLSSDPFGTFAPTFQSAVFTPKIGRAHV